MQRLRTRLLQTIEDTLRDGASLLAAKKKGSEHISQKWKLYLFDSRMAMAGLEERTALAKLEALKDIRAKTIGLEKTRAALLYDVGQLEEEERCLTEYRRELELLQQVCLSGKNSARFNSSKRVINDLSRARLSLCGMIWLLADPPPPVRKLEPATHRETEKERQVDDGRVEGWGRGAESYVHKKAWSSINHSILFVARCSCKMLYILPLEIFLFSYLFRKHLYHVFLKVKTVLSDTTVSVCFYVSITYVV